MKLLFRVSIIWQVAIQLGYAQTIEPTETLSLMQVTFLDFREKPRSQQIILFQNTTDKKIYSATTNDAGLARLLLPEGGTYQIKCIVWGDTVDYDAVVIEKEEGAFSYELTLKYEPPRQFTLHQLHFESGKAEIKPESYPHLDELYQMMLDMPRLVIEISGHTDNVGKPEDNLKLSQERAEAVKNYLIKKGIAPQRIVAKGYGSLKPIAANTSEAGRARNRRTEVKIISE